MQNLPSSGAQTPVGILQVRQSADGKGETETPPLAPWLLPPKALQLSCTGEERKAEEGKRCISVSPEPPAIHTSHRGISNVRLPTVIQNTELNLK